MNTLLPGIFVNFLKYEPDGCVEFFRRYATISIIRSIDPERRGYRSGVLDDNKELSLRSSLPATGRLPVGSNIIEQ